MAYNVEVFYIKNNKIICSLGKGLNFQEAQLIKKEGKGCFIKGVGIRIIKEVLQNG